MKKYVLIKAYLKGNLGDDLFIWTLSRKMKEYSFLLIGPSQYKYFGKEENIIYIPSDSSVFVIISKMVNGVLTILRKLGMYSKNNISREILIATLLKPIIKKVICIGGSLFMENDDFSLDSVKFQEDSWVFNQHPVVLGVNFGPYKNEGYKKIYARLFAEAERIYFRDYYSVRQFEDTLQNIRYAPDVIFGFEMNLLNENQTIDEAEDCIFISIVNLGKDNDGAAEYKGVYFECMRKLIEKVATTKKVVLCAFSIEQGDMETIEEISNELTSSLEIKILGYPRDSVEEILQYMYKSKYIVATRYHAMVLGLAMGKNVFSICYNKKFNYVIDDIGVSKNTYINIEDLEGVEIEKKIEEIYFETSKLEIERLKQDANVMFEDLRKIIV